MKAKLFSASLINGNADQISRQHVAGELNALEVKPEQAREYMREGCFANAGQVLNQ